MSVCRLPGDLGSYESEYILPVDSSSADSTNHGLKKKIFLFNFRMFQKIYLLNLPSAGNYLHTIYIVFITLFIVFTFC